MDQKFSLTKQRSNILNKVFHKFGSEFDFNIKVGAELEFYLRSQRIIVNFQNYNNFITKLSNILKNDELVSEISAEAGKFQIEVKFNYISEINLLAKKIDYIRQFIVEFAQKEGFLADFSAVVQENDCFNALQFSYSFHDKNQKIINNKELLQKSIAGILNLSNEIIFLSIAKSEDLLRYNIQLNKELFKKGKFIAPINISSGFDNRTCLIRYFKDNKRIEFRLPCANCDIYLSLSSLIFAIYYGIKNNLKFDNNCDIYGNSFDQQYQLIELEKDYQKVTDNFLKSKLMQFILN